MREAAPAMTQNKITSSPAKIGFREAYKRRLFLCGTDNFRPPPSQKFSSYAHTWTGAGRCCSLAAASARNTFMKNACIVYTTSFGILLILLSAADCRDEVGLFFRIRRGLYFSLFGCPVFGRATASASQTTTL
jgi:hypothetical protein